MKNLASLIFLIVILFAGLSLKAQNTMGNEMTDEGLAFVQDQYPQLYGIFEKELMEKHATYTFAIDVSGTMKQYAGIVQPALKEFVKALPDGDYVRIIRFGTDAKDKENGYLGTVCSSLKNDLYQAIDNLYSNVNDDKDFRAHTDIPKMVNATCESLLNSTDEMNFVFMLTDFRNDQKGSGEHKLRKEDVESLSERAQQTMFDKEGRIVALELPVNRNASGYCLDQVMDIFKDLNMAREIQPITSEAALSNWFSDLKKQIMVSRLKSIVEKENRLSKPEVELNSDIDGNVKANVNWEPSRLYPTIHVDTCYIAQPLPQFIQERRQEREQAVEGDPNAPSYGRDQKTPQGNGDDDSNGGAASPQGNGISDNNGGAVSPQDNGGRRTPRIGDTNFKFLNNPNVAITTNDPEFDMDLGQVKNEKPGFHKCEDDLVMNVDLPTPYDNELRKLGIKKPIPDTRINMKGKPFFTFFLPLWLLSTLIILFIIYLIGVFNKSKKNNRYKCSGKVSIVDADGNVLAAKQFDVKNKVVSIPGDIKYSPASNKWAVEFYKKKDNPLKSWATKPPFVTVRSVKGSILDPQGVSVCGKNISRFATVYCSPSPHKKDHTHKLTFSMLKITK